MKQFIRPLLVSVAAIAAAGAAQANGASVGGAAAAPAGQLAFPSVFGIASAVPPRSGGGFVALSYVNPRGGVSGSDGDGDLSIGYTIGNPIDAVSATFAANILGLEPFGEDGTLSVGLSRLVHAGGNSITFIGLGFGDLMGWGDAENNNETYTVSVSRLMGVTTEAGREIPMQISVGYGNETTMSDDGRGTVGPGAFVGVGVGVTQSLSASLSATKSQLNVGFSLNVEQLPGLGLSLGMFDVTDNTSRQQVSLGASFSF